MAKKVNKRISKSGNSHLIVKKEKHHDKLVSKKIVNGSNSSFQESFLSKMFSFFDRIRPFPIALLAVLCGFLNSYHQATMFENDRHFSHLSSLEREMTFRTEMGLYYFYYKRLTESPSLLTGLHQIMNDNVTEYPNTINTLERFTLYPEVFLATSYRNAMNLADYLNISLKECWRVFRGDDLPPIQSCIGIGDPAYFYVTSVFLLNGLVGSILFLYGTVLSHSVSGGILSVCCFFFNHGECTRVQWTPPLRESFGYPLFLLQMMLITLTLRCHRLYLSHSLIIATATTLFLLTWQFAQFALFTQILVLCGLYLLNAIGPSTFKCILKGHMIALCVASIFLFGNKMLIASFYASFLVVCYIVSSFEKIFEQAHPFFRMILKGVSVFGGCISLKMIVAFCLKVKDDDHIWNLLRSKFTSYKDFHTLLYTCAAEFDFLPFESYQELSKTLVLPVAVITILIVFYFMFFRRSISLQENSDVLYNILQCVVFAIMAALIMRLKLFSSPHLCLMVSLTMCAKCFKFLSGSHMKGCIFVALLASMSVQGIANLKQQRDIVGEFSNLDFEELLTWINKTLPEDAVFAGPMPTMANILLSTRRPIVNHPHYENAELRGRTYKVYQIFSRKPVAEVHKTLKNMKVNYVILERNWCFGKRKEGCAMVDLWDIEDPANAGNESICQKIMKSAYPFRYVFRNTIYTVLAI